MIESKKYGIHTLCYNNYNIENKKTSYNSLYCISFLEAFLQNTNNLKNNASFGENANAKYQINTLIKNQKDVIKKLDFNIWQKNQTDVRDTYFARYNRQLSTTNSDEYRKFLSDETLTAVFETKVQDDNGQWVEDTPDYLVFGDKTIVYV